MTKVHRHQPIKVNCWTCLRPNLTDGTEYILVPPINEPWSIDIRTETFYSRLDKGAFCLTYLCHVQLLRVCLYIKTQSLFGDKVEKF